MQLYVHQNKHHRQSKYPKRGYIWRSAFHQLTRNLLQLDINTIWFFAAKSIKLPEDFHGSMVRFKTKAMTCWTRLH